MPNTENINTSYMRQLNYRASSIPSYYLFYFILLEYKIFFIKIFYFILFFILLM